MNSNLELVSMLIISKAGEANKLVFDALKQIRKREFEDGYKLLETAKGSINEAHEEHRKLMSEYANGQEFEFNLLFMHAQNYLMNGVLAIDLVEELLEIFKEYTRDFRKD